jgi:DNA-binding NarL/FixJ family response regulator
MLRLLLVDDHVLVRQSIRAFLESEAFEVVGEAGEASAALVLAAELQPDLVMMDIRLSGGMNGIDAVRVLRERHPEMRVVVLTAYDDSVYRQAMQSVGAEGFVSKTAPFSDLLAVIRNVMADRLAGETQNRPRLTEREREVLTAAAKGWTNKQIGLNLHISDRTVQVHLQAIYAKLGASSRVEAISRAMQWGLLSQD